MDQKELNKMLRTSKIYLVYTWVFFVGGFIMFAVLYSSFVDGRLTEIMDRPYILLILIVPFSPAFFLSGKVKKFRKIYEEGQEKLKKK